MIDGYIMAFGLAFVLVMAHIFAKKRLQRKRREKIKKLLDNYEGRY